MQPGERRVVAHFLLGGVKEVLLQLVRAPVPVDRDAVIRDIYSVLSRGVLIAGKKPPAKRAPRRR